MAVLQVNNIKKRFGKTEVLKGVSFSLEKGQVLAIIGSSGSGKTTLLRCLNFLETPDEGEIWVDGKPSYLSGQQLKAMLDGTDGNTIEKIEIISNPSAKYDASGQGGIINIKTKRNMSKGLNGMLSAAYGGMYFGDVKRWLSQEMFSFMLNYRGEKTYTFGQLTQVYSQNDIDFEIIFVFLVIMKSLLSRM